MEKKQPIHIQHHTFKGKQSGGYVYEITFSESLQHTGRMDAMCRGIKRYDRWRKFWFLVHMIIASPLSLTGWKWAKSFWHYTNNRF